MDKITIETPDISKISDGYHTFSELYDHRCLLFINLCLMQPDKCRWKKNHYDGWDAVYLETEYGQISYHCPVKYRHLFLGKILRDENYKYDGHDKCTVIRRLEKTALKA